MNDNTGKPWQPFTKAGTAATAARRSNVGIQMRWRLNISAQTRSAGIGGLLMRARAGVQAQNDERAS
jgi:hypothetical protein